jgi:hypothetical protein
MTERNNRVKKNWEAFLFDTDAEVRSFIVSVLSNLDKPTRQGLGVIHDSIRSYEILFNEVSG